MKIKDAFHVSDGKRIVAEEAYKHKGNMPFVAAQTANEGIIRYSDENWLKGFQKMGESVIVRKPCITWTKNGYAGTLFYRDYPFYPGDDCGVLVPREEFRDRVNMKWFVFAMQDYIKSFTTSKGTQGKLFKEQMSEIDIVLPEKHVQDAMLVQYERIDEIRSKAVELKKIIEETISSAPAHQTQAYSIQIKDAFSIEGGNSGLTEEVVYNHKPKGGSNGIRVYSAASRINSTIWHIDKAATSSSMSLKTFAGPAVIVARKGLAGKAQYIDDKEFATNDNVYVITLKDTYSEDIDLNWFSLVCEHYAQPCISSKDFNGTLCKEQFLLCNIACPSLSEQRETVKIYTRLFKMYYKLLNILAVIDNDTKNRNVFKSLISDLAPLA
ncbi:MAG: restriction endonuclease subunit S [Clostridiales bacterium]|nr:restriction endonuclease subunit S [Clostridiales bacterium]